MLSHIFVDFVALLLWNWMMSAYDFNYKCTSYCTTVQLKHGSALQFATLSLAHTTNTTLFVKKIGEHYLLSLTSVKQM